MNARRFVLTALLTLPLLGSAAFEKKVRYMSDSYIESTSAAQFLNTGLYVTPTMSLEFEFQLLSTNKNTHVYGSDNGSDVYFSWYINATHQWCWKDGGGNWSKSGLSANFERCYLKMDGYNDNVTLKWNNYIAYSSTISSQVTAANRVKTNNCPLVFFGANKIADGKESHYSQTPMRLFWLRIRDKGTLIRDYIPYSNDGVVGMLDRCSGQVYGNSRGVTPFVFGTDDAYVQLNTTNIAAQFSTGYLMTPKTRVELDFAAMSNGKQQRFLSFDGNLVGGLYQTDSGQFGWALQDDTGNWQTTGVAVDGDRRTFILDNANAQVVLTRGTVTNYSATITSTRTKTSTNPVTLFGYPDGTKTAAMRVYGLRIYEDGTLVREYEPRIKDGAAGLYEKKTETFANSSGPRRYSAGGYITVMSDTEEGLAAAGDVYLESDGGQAIDTGYYVNSKTKFEVDYVPMQVSGTTYLLGSCMVLNKTELGLFFQPKDGKFYQKLVYGENGSTWPNLSLAPTESRFKVVVNAATRKYSINGGAESTFSKDVDLSTHTVPLSVFCKTTAKTDSYSYGSYSYARLYSLKLYDGTELKRDFLPTTNGGEAGLWDACEGKFYCSAAKNIGFRLGGAGVNGAGMVNTVSPSSCKLEIEGGDTLKATAPGSIAFQWYKNGEPIAGATGGTLKVEWERKPRTSTYKCVAFYAWHGYQSAEATVTNDPLGLTVILR